MKNVFYFSGWDSNIEYDTIGPNFRWSANKSHIHIINDNDYKYLNILIGSHTNKTVIVTCDNIDTTLNITSGWHEYQIEISKDTKDIYFSCDDYITENRVAIQTLAFQVSNITLSHDHNYQYKFDNLKSKYLDIVYVSNIVVKTQSQLIIKSTDFEQKIPIFSGGERVVCFKIPDQFTTKFEFDILCNDSKIQIKSIVNRIDYYDFLGLEQNADIESKLNLLESKEAAFKIPLAIQWFVTWKCNMKCGYCWQESAKSVYRTIKSKLDIPVSTWVEKINQINPYKLYFTGGEPSLFKQLPEIICKLNKNIRFDMTSNFGKTFILDEWKDIDFSRWDYMSFSFHPTQWSRPDEFFEKLEKFFQITNVVKSRIGIEMVLHDDNLKLVDPQRIIDFSTKHNLIKPNLDEFVDSKIPQQQVNSEQFISTVNSNTSKSYDLKYTTTDTGRQPVYCAAGMRRINIDSDGNVFTCMSAIDRSKLFDTSALPHYTPISNIFDDDFKLNDRPILCWESFRCSACDYQSVDTTWKPFKSKFNNQLPLPE
jgi:sulfatase maturation enzyme AslB (radical SAM superfamily)